MPAEKKEIAEDTVTKPEEETVAKSEYDSLASEFNKLRLAYNKLLGMVANDYADKLTKAIFEEVDKEMTR